MESERFSGSRDNPRALGLANDRPPRAAPVDRPSPPILDRFRALLREREEELRALGEDEPPPPSAQEVVRLYEEVLSELVFNSKPVITELTILAGEQREFAEGIADAICSRILEAPIDQKLPSLYLLDSIVKNIGREYVRYFAERLAEVFCEAYNQVHSSLHPAMRHLFGTWSQVFPYYVLRTIEEELQFSTPDSQQSTGSTNTRHSESPSSRPSHGIHINPKYLEARRHLEHSSADYQDARGASSSLQSAGQKSSAHYGEYDFEHNDVIPPRQGAVGRGSPQTAGGHEPSMVTMEGGIASSKIKGFRPAPAPTIRLRGSTSPSGDRVKKEISPVRAVPGAALSDSRHGFGPSKLSERNGWLGKSWSSDYTYQRPEDFSAYNFNRQRTRELIDAYGNYRGKSIFEEKVPKVMRLESNGANSDVATRRWQNTEEEEYVWEDMNPTLASQRRENSLPPVEPLTTRTSVRKRGGTYVESDFRRAYWSSHSKASHVDDPAFKFEDRIPLTSGSSQLAQDSWKLPYDIPKLPVPISVSGRESLSGHRVPEAEIPIQRLSNLNSDSLRVNASTFEKHLTERPYSPPNPSTILASSHKSQPLPLHSLPLHQKQFKSQFDLIDTHKPIIGQGPKSSLVLPLQQYDATDKKAMDTKTLHHLPYQRSGSVQLNHPNRVQGEAMPLQLHESHGNLISSAPVQLSSRLVAPPLNISHTQEMGVPLGSVLPNSLTGLPSSHVTYKTYDNSLHALGVNLPPLPPGPPPPSVQIASASINSNISSSPANPFSGLLSSLMEKGLISLQPQSSSQDPVGVEFNADLLKVRHESAINALYTELPRQCMTCGMRFRCQEEHGAHMDWHVTKNRISKNRKQKPSRKWFVSAKEWLSGAEALGTDFVPGFLAPETVTEKGEDKELAVPADENQNVCALCAEPFEDFYSDETEEWMYKGAIYLNAPDGNVEGLDRSQLGPIVHAKCRSESAKGFAEA
ncbi:putative transcription factor C2H2 family [Dioscorea sansibarensis]